MFKKNVLILNIRFHLDKNGFIYYINFIDKIRFCLSNVYEIFFVNKYTTLTFILNSIVYIK